MRVEREMGRRVMKIKKHFGSNRTCNEKKGKPCIESLSLSFDIVFEGRERERDVETGRKRVRKKWRDLSLEMGKK